jgi:hypothetical protein
MDKAKYTLKDISKSMKVDVKILRSYISRGALRATKVGRAYLVTATDLEMFLKHHKIDRKHTARQKKFCMRNYLCRNYDNCLDEAARDNRWFDCEECEKFTPADKQEITSSELGGMISLWKCVFGKELTI